MSHHLASINEFNVHIYRNKNVVYLATLKAASTFYTSLVLANNWEVIRFSDINWSIDHVFGFIVDPKVRYLKAVTEDYFNEEVEMVIDGIEDWVPDPEFQNILCAILGKHKSQCFVLTHHSLPLSVTLGDYVRKIDWIPADTDIRSEIFFTKLCEKYKIAIDYTSENIDEHKSNAYKTLIFNKLKDLFGNGNYFQELVLAKDIDLYNEVKSKFNVNGSTWDEISWLRNQ